MSLPRLSKYSVRKWRVSPFRPVRRKFSAIFRQSDSRSGWLSFNSSWEFLLFPVFAADNLVAFPDVAVGKRPVGFLIATGSVH